MTVSPRAVGFADVPEMAGAPFTGPELVAELRRVHSESVHYWAAYDTPAFFRRPAPDVWAPADQVRHLTKSIRAVSRGVGLPRPLMLVLFGWSRRTSRTLETLQADYRTALARGAGAGGFAPRPLDASEQNESNRARLMAHHAAAIDGLCGPLERWSERALDRYRLPHPLMGKLTVREMMLFTLVHNVHHVRVAERRRRELAASTENGGTARALT
jgi:hypothetical protein